MATNIKIDLIIKNYDLALPESIPSNFSDWIDELNDDDLYKLRGYLADNFGSLIETQITDARKFCRQCLSKLETKFSEWLNSVDFENYAIAFCCIEENSRQKSWYWSKAYQDFFKYDSPIEVRAIPLVSNSYKNFKSKYVEKRLSEIFADAAKNSGRRERLIEFIEHFDSSEFNEKLSQLKQLRKRSAKVDISDEDAKFIELLNELRVKSNSIKYKQIAKKIDELHIKIERQGVNSLSSSERNFNCFDFSAYGKNGHPTLANSSSPTRGK